MANIKETANLGKWGRLHYDYLYRSKRTVINAMRLKGTLQAYLEQFDADTQDSFEKLVKHTAEVGNVTEELKAPDQMEWLHRMNNIRNRCEEFNKRKIECVDLKKGRVPNLITWHS